MYRTDSAGRNTLRAPSPIVRFSPPEPDVLAFFSPFRPITDALVAPLSSRRARIVGRSMEPTLSDADRVLVSRAAYWRASPRRDDIVLAKMAGWDVALIKRIVGVPGDTVWVSGDAQRIEVAPTSAGESPRLDGTALVLGDDEFFLVGDNRGDSLDSRSLGPAQLGEIMGRVWYRYGPAGREGRLRRDQPRQI